MYRIINNRGTGKTKKLMLLAKDNEALFVCANPHAMEQKALAYGITGLNFLSYDNAPCYYEEGKTLNVVIDDIEAFVKWFISNDKLIGYTLTNED